MTLTRKGSQITAGLLHSGCWALWVFGRSAHEWTLESVPLEAVYFAVRLVTVVLRDPLKDAVS